MAIIINDFEVVVEPQASQSANQDETIRTKEQELSQQKISPYDLNSIIRKLNERAVRVRAH